MPKKNNSDPADRLSFSLSKGACHLLDQLVELGIHGDSHSETVRFLVQTQLRVILDKGYISLPRNSATEEPE